MKVLAIFNFKAPSVTFIFFIFSVKMSLVMHLLFVLMVYCNVFSINFPK